MAYSLSMTSIFDSRPKFHRLSIESQNLVRNIFDNNTPECFIFVYVIPNCDSCKMLLNDIDIIQKNYNNVYILDMSGSPLSYVRNMYYPLSFLHRLNEYQSKGLMRLFYISLVPRMDIFYFYDDSFFTFSNADIQSLSLYHKRGKKLSDFYKNFASKSKIRNILTRYETSMKCLAK